MTFGFGLLHMKICMLNMSLGEFKCEMVLQWMGSWQPFQVEGENFGKPSTYSSEISLNVLVMQRRLPY